MSIQYVTKETFEQIKADLQHMKGVDRPAASRAIAEAREKSWPHERFLQSGEHAS